MFRLYWPHSPLAPSHRELDGLLYYTVKRHFYQICQLSRPARKNFPVPQFTLNRLVMRYFDYRGGRRPWRGSSGSTPLQGPIQTPPAPPLGSLLEEVTPLQCTEDDDGAREIVSITGTKFLASYNWTDDRDPSIVFPGKLCQKRFLLQ